MQAIECKKCGAFNPVPRFCRECHESLLNNDKAGSNQGKASGHPGSSEHYRGTNVLIIKGEH